MRNEYILGIESSCDETSMAVLKDNDEILSNVVSSQIATHQKYGGVMPEVASRLHVENLGYVLDTCMKEANISFKQLSAVAVCGAPGLIGGLQIGMIAAKTIALYYDIPLLYVHHLAGHIYANEFVKPLVFPCLAVVISGGNSELVIMNEHLDFKIIGETQDDAIGESFDKVARMLGLPYPGGVAIDRLCQNHSMATLKLPKPHVKGYDLSYSGIKSHLCRYINQLKEKDELNEELIETIACSAEHAFFEQLIEKIRLAAKEYKVKQIIVGGGVSANSYLRSELMKEFSSTFDLVLPPLWCTTDNAAMISKVGHYMLEKGYISDLGCSSKANLSLEDYYRSLALLNKSKQI